MDRTIEAVEQVSPAEARFGRWRRAAGCVVAPAAFAAPMPLPPPGLKPEAYRLAAAMAGRCAAVGDSDLIG